MTPCSIAPGQVWRTDTGSRVRIRRPSRVPGCWVWIIETLGRGERGKVPTIGAGRVDTRTWKLVQEAPIVASST